MNLNSRRLDKKFIYINKLKQCLPRDIHVVRIRLQRSCKFNYLTLLAITRYFFREKNLLRFFLFIYVLYFIGLLAIIRANIYFVDDNIRSVTGSFGAWSLISRHSMIKLAEIFNFGTPLVEFSPLSNIICIFFLSCSSIILVKIINKKLSYIALTASLFIGLNPYFLENLLYKFDSIYMCISLLMTLIPFLFCARKQLFCIISICCLLSMLTIYQSVTFIYLLIAGFLLFINLSSKRNNKKHYKFFIFCIICYLIPLTLFKIFIFNHFTGHINTQTFPLNKLLNGVIINILNFYHYICKHWIENYNLMYLFKLIIFLTYIYTLARFKKLKSILLLTLFLTVGFTFSQGIFLFIERMPLRPRYVSTIGVLFAIILIYICDFDKLKFNRFNKIFIFISKSSVCYICYIIIFMANMLGSILQEQARYLDFRAYLAVHDLSKFSDFKNINFIKEIYSPSVIVPLKKFPVFTQIIPKSLSGYGYNQLTRNLQKYNYEKCQGKSHVLITTNFHTINKYENNCFEVIFK